MSNRLKLLVVLLFTASQFILSKGQGQSYYALSFVENKGQWDGNFSFRAEAGNGAFFVAPSGFTILQHHPDDYHKINDHLHGHTVTATTTGKPGEPAMELPEPGDDKFVIRSHAVAVKFLGSSSQAIAAPEQVRDGVDNYFIGNDPSRWKSNVRTYSRLTYREIYPNTDVTYYSDGGRLKYDFHLRPGADLSRLVLSYDGAQKLSVKNGELIIQTSVGEIRELSPYAYQVVNGYKKEVECRFEVDGNRVKFRVKDYNPSAMLVIDPTLVFSTFSGSRSGNWGFTATPGDDGSFFSGGIVFNGGGYPITPGAFQSTFQGGGQLGVDIGITRLSPLGNTRIYSTYLGGNSDEFPHSMFADPQGNLVVLGRTFSTNFPTTASFGPGGSADIFVTKLNASGTALIGSMRIGGSGNDGANIDASGTPGCTSLLYNYGDNARSEVILDAANNIYIAASTQSANFPTLNPFQASIGGKQDAVFVKINPTVSTVIASSYLGGSEDDAGFVLSINPTDGNIYLAGGTSSNNMPNASNAYGGAIDGYISIISNSGASLLQTRYLGTASLDMIYGIQFDTGGFPYVMGISLGAWTVSNVTYSNPGSHQFISKLKPDLSGYVYSTVYGSAGAVPNISPVAFLVDRCENVYVSGWGGRLNTCVSNNCFDGKTLGPAGMPITPDAIKSTTDNRDFYFFVLEKNATKQLYGSFFGQSGGEGDHVDGGTSRFDKRGAIYQAICANCLGNNACPQSPITLPFPVTPGVVSPVNGALGTGSGGECNLASVKILFDYQGVIGAPRASINGVIHDTSGCAPLGVDFEDTIGNAQRWVWDFGDGSPVVSDTKPTVSHVFTTVGTFRVQLIVIDSTRCIPRDTTFLTIISRNDKATVNYAIAKLPPCQSLSYRFDNLSIAPAGKPFNNRSFVWDFGDNTPTVNTGNASVTHTYASAGAYKVKLLMVDTSYCNYPDSAVQTLRVAPNVVAGFTTPASGCVPYTAVFANTSQAGQTFLWDFGDGTTFTGSTPPPKLYSSVGTYTVTLIATDPATCNGADTFSAQIKVNPEPVANFTFSPNPGQENTPTRFTNTSTGAVRYFWAFGDGDSSTLVNPVHQFNTTAIFTTCLLAVNSFGCIDTVCQQVSAQVVPLLDVPNAFTPNGDGTNDKIYVRGFGIARLDFRIYNRQGQMVFRTADQSVGWDGRYKGALQPMDVYAYILEVEFSDKSRATKKGDITLLR